MAPIAAPPKDRVLRGILMMCLAVACFSSLNASAKWLGNDFSMSQVVWVRYLGSTAIMLILFMPKHGLRLFRPRHPWLQTLRGVLLFGSSALYFQGLSHLSLATGATISMTSPLLITALSVPFLAESVGPRRWAAVCAGFIGALIVIRPGMGDTSLYILFFVGSTLCSTFYALMTRKYAGEERPEVSATIATLVGTVAGAPMALMTWETPVEPLPIALFAVIGIFAGLGHYLFTVAFQHGPAAVISPFSYLQLIGAAIFGLILFGDFPDQWTWIGGAIIMASGLYIAHRERIRSRGRKTP